MSLCLLDQQHSHLRPVITDQVCLLQNSSLAGCDIQWSEKCHNVFVLSCCRIATKAFVQLSVRAKHCSETCCCNLRKACFFFFSCQVDFMCVESVTSPCWPGMIRFNPFSIASGHSLDDQILNLTQCPSLLPLKIKQPPKWTHFQALITMNQYKENA